VNAPQLVVSASNGRAAHQESTALLLQWRTHADVAQLVEHHLAKVRVAGSNPVVRSRSEAFLLSRPWRLAMTWP